jgi:prevent-host-death family protein
METVGVRDLKARLSHHLRRVRAGHGLVVTDRGRPVASIQAIGSTTDTEWARALVTDGRAQWSGGKPKGANRPFVSSGTRSASDVVLEDRR